MKQFFGLLFLFLGIQTLFTNANNEYLNENHYCQFESGICDDVPHVACPSSAVSWNLKWNWKKIF